MKIIIESVCMILLVSSTCGIPVHPTQSQPIHITDEEEAPEPPEDTTPTQHGCFYNGRVYPPGMEIENGYDSSSNWCWWTICGGDGNIINADNFNCITTSETPTTVPDARTPSGDAGTVDVGEDGAARTGIDIGEQGEDGDEDLMASPVPTTAEEQPTTPFGCYQNERFYPPNAEISRGFDGLNWCYGSYCDNEGRVVMWDDWHCGQATAEQGTTQSPETPPSESSTQDSDVDEEV